LKIDFGQIIEDEKSLKSALINDLAFAISFVDKNIANHKDLKITSASAIVTQTKTREWLYSVGQVPWAGVGVVTAVPGGALEMDFYYTYKELYDFDYLPLYGGIFTDATNRRFHDVGLASEFIVSGVSSKIKVKWCPGRWRAPRRNDVNFLKGGVLDLRKEEK
jgi:hypothetical protein